MSASPPPQGVPPQFGPPPSYAPPGYAPVPVPLPRPALFFQAIRGPIVLIVLGVLFWVHQAGIISFWRTWPLLIIVIGFLKLLERLATPRSMPGSPGPYTRGQYQ